jgi:hypothetical protein
VTDSWGALFERAGEYGVDREAVSRTLADRRERDRSGREADETDPNGSMAGDTPSADVGGDEGAGGPPSAGDPPNPARVVADADVLAADLLVGGPARAALDRVREHSWVALVGSDPLLDDAAGVIGTLADAALARAWHERLDPALRVAPPPGDHPALAAAFHGSAAHVLAFDEALRGARAGATIRARVATSVKHPAGFARLFDPAALHETVVGGAYSGPDCDPRS